TRFVADFIGATTFWKGVVAGVSDNGAHVRLPSGDILDARKVSAMTPRSGDEVSVAIRSERVQLANSNSAHNVISGHIASSDYLGSKWHHTVETPAGILMFETLDHAEGEVRVYLPPDALIVIND
ncbi:MAG: TOBE domain-containing protein, partial [Chloroflexia bacterium]